MISQLESLESCVSFLVKQANGEDPEGVERARLQAQRAIEELREGRTLRLELDSGTMGTLERLARSAERVAVGLDKAREDATRSTPTVPSMGGRRS